MLGSTTILCKYKKAINPFILYLRFVNVFYQINVKMINFHLCNKVSFKSKRININKRKSLLNELLFVITFYKLSLKTCKYYKLTTIFKQTNPKDFPNHFHAVHKTECKVINSHTHYNIHTFVLKALLEYYHTTFGIVFDEHKSSPTI